MFDFGVDWHVGFVIVFDRFPFLVGEECCTPQQYFSYTSYCNVVLLVIKLKSSSSSTSTLLAIYTIVNNSNDDYTTLLLACSLLLLLFFAHVMFAITGCK